MVGYSKNNFVTDYLPFNAKNKLFAFMANQNDSFLRTFFRWLAKVLDENCIPRTIQFCDVRFVHI